MLGSTGVRRSGAGARAAAEGYAVFHGSPDGACRPASGPGAVRPGSGVVRPEPGALRPASRRDEHARFRLLSAEGAPGTGVEGLQDATQRIGQISIDVGRRQKSILLNNVDVLLITVIKYRNLLV